MTEPSIYAQDVSKLRDADELRQACIGLKDTNRWVHLLSSLPLLKLLCPLTTTRGAAEPAGPADQV